MAPKEHEKRKQQSASNPDYSTALNIRECVLEVQALHLIQLAAELNHVKEVEMIPGTPTFEFEKDRKEVERVIEVLRSQERSSDHRGVGI